MLKTALLLLCVPLLGLTSMAHYKTPLDTLDIIWNFKLNYGIVKPSVDLQEISLHDEDINTVIDYITITVIGEAARQPLRGKVSIVHVILNRYMENIAKGKYLSIKEVVLQRKQFSCWLKKYNCKKLHSSKTFRKTKLYQETYHIVTDVLLDRYKRFIKDSTHYAHVKLVRKLYKKKDSQFFCSGFNKKITLYKIGDHTFCR